MVDSSFIDLLSDKNLKKIDIDKRLIPAFKKIMKEFQLYFNKMGYTKTRDYKKFFKRYLLTDDISKKVSIKCNREPEKFSCSGFFSYENRKIVIDENLLDDDELVVDTLAHEFIHFLVDNNINNKFVFTFEGDTFDYNLYNMLYNSSLSEALTEMLKTKIFPLYYKGYIPLIKMVEFWFIFNDKEIDIDAYLSEGIIDFADSRFLELLNEYFYNIDNDGNFDIVRKNKDYIKVQRYVINNLKMDINCIEDYEQLVHKISKRPAEDITFINNYYLKIQDKLCDDLNIKNKEIRKRFKYYLKKYRLIIEAIVKTEVDNKNLFYKFKFNDMDFLIDSDKKLFVNEQFVKEIGYFKLSYDNEFLMFNYNNIDFRDIKLRKEKLKRYLYKQKSRIRCILKYIKFINDNEIIENYAELPKIKKK